MKKCTVFILVAMLLLNSIAYAMPTQMKNETVYINLSDYGEVSEINIYNKCTLNGSSNIIDYTKYSEVTNLTNRTNYVVSGDSINWDVSGENSFSYTGKVGEEYYKLIPWNFNISYKLNGVEVSKDELLGSSGLVEVNIEINANKEANEYYQNNYILEITGSYDMSNYLSLNSDDAMITDNGNTKTLMFIVLPGQSTELNIEFGTDNFEMDGITMAMVPLTGDLLNNVVDLIEDKNDMENAIDSMNNSADIVLNSLYGMSSGLNGISVGVNEIKNGVNEVHGLNSLRDQDIENLKNILNNVLPIIQNVQTDLDNLTSTYTTFIDLSSDLNEEVKDMSDNVSALVDDLDILEDMAKDLPKDVKEINKLLEDAADVTKDLNTLLGYLTSSNKKTQEELTALMNQIGKSVETIYGTADALESLVDEPIKNYVSKIKNESLSLIKNLSVLGTTLQSMQSAMPDSSSTSKDIKELSNQLDKVSSLLDDEEAEIFENTIKDTKKIVNSLGNMLDITAEYSDKLLENKDDFYTAIDNTRQLINELNEMDTLSISMISNLQTTLNILSSDIYTGSDKTTDELLNVNKQLISITNESNAIKSSKNEVKNILDDRVDEIESKTTLFNIDKDAKAVSFGNSKNENVESVQFILKTPDIKNVKVENNDMEVSTNNMSFWDRVLIILDKMFGWVVKIFKH